jgi:hypothetical protein
MDSEGTPRVPCTGGTRVVAKWQEFPAFTPPMGQIYKNDLPPKVLIAGAYEDRNSQLTSENG